MSVGSKFIKRLRLVIVSVYFVPVRFRNLLALSIVSTSAGKPVAPISLLEGPF
jgi:hypothetical protein